MSKFTTDIVVQVKVGFVFDNILICDDLDCAKHAVDQYFTYFRLNCVLDYMFAYFN
jgi:hypothetical protein